MKQKFLCLIVVCLHVLTIKAQERKGLFEPEYFEHQRFAHRGGYELGSENTIETILSNLSRKVTSIEIDIRLTRDGTLILFHDETLGRLLDTDRKESVSELNLNDLKKIPFRSDPDQRVNSLAELLDTLNVFIPANGIEQFLLELDFKPHGKKAEEAVEVLIKLLEKYETRYGKQIYDHIFVSSFYPEVLRAMNEKKPIVKTAFAVNNNPETDKLAAKLTVLLAPMIIRKYDVEIIEPHLCMVNPGFVRKWHRRGVLINAYTANTKCEKDYLEQFRIAYTTNCPQGYCKNDPSDALGKPTSWCKQCTESDTGH